MKLELIHYGAGSYDPALFTPVFHDRYSLGNKPRGGLWGSPVDATYGWAAWCADNSFGDLSTFFTFSYESDNIIVIDSAEDVNQLPWVPGLTRYRDRIDVDALTCDAIWLTAKGEAETRFTDPHSLYGWDCESVLILNPEHIHETTAQLGGEARPTNKQSGRLSGPVKILS